MPRYIFYCEHCDESFDFWQSMKDEPLRNHPGCGAAVVKVITGVRTYGVGDRGAQTRYSDSMDAQLDRDRPAYKRLRAEGHQPQAVIGADALEARATDDWYIKTGGRVQVPDNRKAEVNEMLAEGAMSSWNPVEQVHAERSK